MTAEAPNDSSLLLPTVASEPQRPIGQLSCLQALLQKTSIYAQFLAEKLAKDQQKEQASLRKRKTHTAAPRTSQSKKPKKGRGKEQFSASLHVTDAKVLDGSIFHGQLRPYQQDGLNWLVSLYENGMNGILADEMGLGKTIQVIAFLSFLLEKQAWGPVLIVAPTSILGNWSAELHRFAPFLPQLIYHGSIQERFALRSEHFPKLERASNDCPIVITSYDISMNDRIYFTKIKWKYLIIDEGHRLKNYRCKLMHDLKTLSSENRLLLTGTPLQNNLSELWSLLNFILPEIFDDLKSFENWFEINLEKEMAKNHQNSAEAISEDETDMQYPEQLKAEQEKYEEHLDEERLHILHQLHEIMKPFVLRRLKADVEKDLPKKREYIVYASLTPLQQEYYIAALEKNLANLIKERKKADLEDRAVSYQNIIIQLRKICNHPYLIFHPSDPKHKQYLLNDESIIYNCGKMKILNQILPKLLVDGHKVLIFSQMTSMLDILEDYIQMFVMKKYGANYVRIDGSTVQSTRSSIVAKFNDNASVKIFLLSTRAGGLGLNLTAADTVILYDSDWNPQMDLQAQDRVHRIGQQKPVSIFRLITANTAESHLLDVAHEKRQLERLVIHKSRFKNPVNADSGLTLEELKEILESDQALGHFNGKNSRLGELLSDAELKLLLRRDWQEVDASGALEFVRAFHIVKESESSSAY